MHREYPVPSASTQSISQPRQSKATTQKQYREKEGECFAALRDVIKQITGEVLQTRQEILSKAIELLSSLLEAGKQEQAGLSPTVLCDVPVAGTSNPTDTNSDHIAYSPQSYGLHPWQNAYYPVQAHASGWQYPSMSNMDFAFEEQADDEQFSENWSHDSQA